jgi:chromosome segregation ATPase
LGRDILAEEGRSASDAIVERIAKTLEAAALDEGSRSLLRAGRLTEELEPPGFEALAGMAATGARSKQPRAPGPTGKRDRITGVRRQVQEARQEARVRAREAAAAERDAERAEAAAADARQAAEEARERADAAGQALAEAETALRDAKRG